VLRIVRQQLGHAVDHHGRGDVGVMDAMAEFGKDLIRAKSCAMTAGVSDSNSS
jgi:hypothetical protein